MAKASGHLSLLDGQLKDAIAPLLDESGFSRAGQTRLWLRPSLTGKQIHHLVWFQIGESASSQAGRFTVELGLYYPKYDRFCNGRELFGPGIAAEHLPRLTERFYRVDVGESRAQGGTGLGLALVKHILNRHHGRLTIDSKIGEGATFTVRIPLS